MTQTKKTDTQAKRKVWMVFLISALITGCICYVSYESFVTLTGSIDQLSKPDQRVELINETFQEIVEAENNIQSFILSNDPKLEKQYLLHSRAAKQKIRSLKVRLQSDSVQYARVDSLETLFDTKMLNLEAFLKIKNRRQQAIYTGEALDEIQKQLKDSTLSERQLLRQELFDGEFVPVERQHIEIVEEETKGLKGFFRKIVGAENTRVDTVTTVEEELRLAKIIRVDTSIVKDNRADTTLQEVKTILNEVLKKEKRVKRQMSSQELAMLRQDMVFISSIRSIIGELKEKEKKESAISNEKATESAARSTLFIISTGFVGLMMSAAFLFLILKDITGSFFYRNQLEKEKNRAEKLAQAKEDFLSNMSHEIRTPLQSIKGFSELIAQTNLDDKQAKFLKAIRYSNDYLSELISDVLDQAKIEAGMLELDKRPFDMQLIMEELETIYGKVCEQKGIALKGSISGLQGVKLLGDAVRLKQVLINLLSNAIKFTKEGTIDLEVAGTEKGNMMDLSIIVRDTGAGISKEMQQVIFDQFTQEVNAESQNYRGTGLGLSIAKNLIEAMGGEVGLISELGEGSTFTLSLSLPYLEEEESQLSLVSDDQMASRFAVKVMVVEDDDWNGTLLREILLQHVEEVFLFQQAAEALVFLQSRSQEVNLIFSDIKMAGMDGVAFLSQLRTEQIHIPVIALTAHVQMDKLEALKAEGFDQVFSKPYDAADIQSILSNYFESSDREEESTVVLEEKKDKVSRFDYSIIRKFAGGNEETFQRLLASLLTNNERQLVDYQAYLDAADATQLGELAHQMKTTYDNLGLPLISEALASIELHEQLGQTDRAVTSARELRAELATVLDELRQDLKSLFDIS
ncbi:His Kinase A (phospho-acceptor) domain-containing protein [Reichenbachiella agariperforans]|uniref:histidine kinase n=1 Tax=Reichenbachiella agariperforans TaxID=156994 RepID=A0A1M6PAN8_REIAG|nr:ATP-binding protein [Reichenbachiella agariperforans]SHK05015.1 His Kinase A (phospho-acceptor) domain-containing protein [Reichenbachiella agariperforans]